MNDRGATGLFRISTGQKKKIIHISTSFIKVDTKWFRDLNVKAKNINLLKESIEENICNLEIGKGFPHRTQKALTMKEKKVKQLDFIKI